MTTQKHQKRLDRSNQQKTPDKQSNDNKRNDADDPSLTTVFNRVVSHPDHLNGEHYLINTDVAVNEVIDFLSQGHDDTFIQKQFNGLSKSGLDACRAYQVRFRPETVEPSMTLDKDDKFFLLDENISYLILYDVAKTFGYSTHVGAEGMLGHGPNHDDEKNIWAHAVIEQYKVILTADCDFIDIAERNKESRIEKYGTLDNSPEHMPVVIHIKPGTTAQHILRLLQKHEETIRDFADQNQHVCAYLVEKGLRLKAPEKVKKCAERKAEANNQPPPSYP